MKQSGRKRVTKKEVGIDTVLFVLKFIEFPPSGTKRIRTIFSLQLGLIFGGVISFLTGTPRNTWSRCWRESTAASVEIVLFFSVFLSRGNTEKEVEMERGEGGGGLKSWYSRSPQQGEPRLQFFTDISAIGKKACPRRGRLTQLAKDGTR